MAWHDTAQTTPEQITTLHRVTSRHITSDLQGSYTRWLFPPQALRYAPWLEPDLAAGLLNAAEPEADFFNNVTHVQVRFGWAYG